MISEVPPIARNWWLFVVLGVICLATAIAALVWPDVTLLVLGIIVGIHLMIAAVVELIDAAFGDPGGRAISAVLGVLALLAGLICFRRPGESLLVIELALSFYLVAAGAIRVVRAFVSDGLRWWGVALGAVEAAIGIVILASPGIGLKTLVVVFALSMLFRGAVVLVAGFKLRTLKEDAGDPVDRSAMVTAPGTR